MKCPVDQTELKRAEREGIEIDHCPACRGVWLDRGELDKIIARSADASGRGDAGSAGDRHPVYDAADGERGAYMPADREEFAARATSRRGLLGELFNLD
jgi:Zn-finger nucleic acid-binding protein